VPKDNDNQSTSKESGAALAPDAPHDVWGYRIAVAGISLGLFAFLLGAAIVGASGHTMTQEYWTIGAALSGALVGILVPSPIQKQVASDNRAEAKAARLGHAATPTTKTSISYWASFVAPGLLAVMLVAALSVAAVTHGATAEQLRALAAASGGALVGMLARSPSPSKNTR
jgi:hypothetical protein